MTRDSLAPRSDGEEVCSSGLASLPCCTRNNGGEVNGLTHMYVKVDCVISGKSHTLSEPQ